jgi:hypothetical protein
MNLNKDEIETVATALFNSMARHLEQATMKMAMMGVPANLIVELTALALEESAYIFSRGPAQEITENDEKLLEHAARVMAEIGEAALEEARRG